MFGPLERYMTPTLDAALLISFRAGADLGRMLDSLESNVSPRREGEVGADENPFLQFQNKFFFFLNVGPPTESFFLMTI